MILEDYLLKLSKYKSPPMLPLKSRLLILLSVLAVFLFGGVLEYWYIFIYIQDAVSPLFLMLFFIAEAAMAYWLGNQCYKELHKRTIEDHIRYFQIAKIITTVPESKDLQNADQQLADSILSSDIPFEHALTDKLAKIRKEAVNSDITPYLNFVSELYRK